MKSNKKTIIYGVLFLFLIVASIFFTRTDKTTIQTSGNIEISNTKIEWGIKRGNNHEQPDLGNINKQLIEKYNGLALGNSEDKYIYLTFDEGYEAGYTSQILKVLKENDVRATFFITAHYLNTQPELVKQMIDEGHIVGNQF